MKIYIYEPDGIQSPMGVNISKRVEHIKKVLAKYNLEELTKIQEHRDNKTLAILDDSNNIIIAHYTDVEKLKFHELKLFKNAITIFHTYDSSWDRDRIASNSICKALNNNKNRFCIGSTELKENIKAFVSHLEKTGEINFEILEGFTSSKLK